MDETSFFSPLKPITDFEYKYFIRERLPGLLIIASVGDPETELFAGSGISTTNNGSA
jgi:hypothetical protein